MRLNDVYPVLLASEGQQFHVADAVVVDIDSDEVTLEIPGVVVRMGIAHSLTEPKREEGPDRILSDSTFDTGDLDADDRAARERDLVGDAPVRQETSLHQRELDSSVLD